MASTYYDSSGKEVADGEIAYASDLNDINTSVDTAFQQVELDIDTVSTNQSYYSDLAEKWATELENTEVEAGKYSALHWAAKAEDQALLADADRVQTNADRVQTGLDRTQTGIDKAATAADRVQTGLDKSATAADRVQTGLDAAATAADRVQTGLDAAAAAAAISDTAYGVSWNGATTSTPTQNAIYDKMETMAPLTSPALTGTPTAPTATAGTNTTQIATTAFVLANSSPVGSVITWLTETAPTGYFECDGSAKNRSTYSSLYAVIGTTFGAGDGSTTFNLPDLRGEFLRGWAHGTTNDPDKATRTNRGDGTTGDHVGTKQADELEGHTHTVAVFSNNVLGTGGSNVMLPGGGLTTGSTGGNETRPRNVNVMYCIKY